MTPRARSEAFRLAVVVGAVAVFVATAGRLAASGQTDWRIAGALFVVGLLALYFPLHVALSEKVSVAAAVFFAAALLLPPWQAAVLVAVTQAINTSASAFRKARSTRQMPPMRAVGNSLLFNAAQAYFSVLAAGLVLQAAGVSARSGITGAATIAAVAVAALAMYLVNLMLVSTASALATSRNPIRVFSSTQKVISAQFACLYLLGAMAAFTAIRFPWLLLLVSVPAFLVYRSIQNRIELKRTAVLAVERMADEVDARDRYTFQHSQRVAIYSHAIGRKLGLSTPEVELLELAAKVHDIGKIRIPDAVLLKPGKLTPEERRVMEAHPRLGFEILSRFSEYARVLELVLTHHERYDGGGYPNGIVGRRLLLIAQVIPVADSLDAMTTARTYRGALGWDAALAELRRGAGSQWNPQVVAAALGALERHTEEGDIQPLQRPRSRSSFAGGQVRTA
jgi:putative nucleotidyltransferase with HDIG domain